MTSPISGGDTMKKSVFTILLVLFILCSMSFSEGFSGVVFNDNNKNGLMDPEESGISGVSVSNGVNVVQTSEDGSYELPVRDKAVFFITKPAGYDLPLDGNNLPQFFYRHYPNGSPELDYQGIEPTGPLPETVNFPLYKTEVNNTFDVYVIGDPQTKLKSEIGYLRDDIFTELLSEDARFAIVLGDIMDDRLELYPDYVQLCRTMDFPIYHVPGNHDVNYKAPTDKHSLDTYKRYFGPGYYSFDYGDVHFMVLDTVEYQGNSSYIGNIPDKQMAWIANDLEYVPKDKLIVLAMHIPLYSKVDNPGSKNHVRNIDELIQLLGDRERILALAGHTHTTENTYLDEKHGREGNPILMKICGAACGSWWGGDFDERGIPGSTQTDGTPNGYFIFSFDGSHYTDRFKPANKDDDFQIRVSAPRGTVDKSMLKYEDIVVNCFNSDNDSEVLVSVDGSAYQKMKMKNFYDPYIKTVYNDSLSYGSPSLCYHLWFHPLPEDLEPGIHRIDVRFTDRYENVYEQHRLFQVE